MSPLRIQLDRIRRRSWLVLAVMGLAVVSAFAATWAEETVYTGRSTLTITSDERAPEQDAVLAQGYTEYFNEPSYQDTLRERAGVPAEVPFSARTAAASPIVYIEAAAPNPDVAASAASAMAATFRDDVNENLRAGRDQAIEELSNEIAAERAELATVPDEGAESTLITSTILALQERIAAIQSDTSNQLQELQLDAGVSSSPPHPVQNVALGLVGGLILGCLAALAFAAVENRLATADEVRDQLGLDTLAVIPGGKSRSAARSRAQYLMRLANLVGLSDLPRPMTVAVTTPRATASTAQIAAAIAAYRAVQGEQTLLVEANLHDEHHDHRAGVADFLDGPSGIGLDDVVVRGRIRNMQVMPAGHPSADPYALFSRDRFGDLVEHAKSIADLVVIESPPITEAAEGQVVCTTTDRVILVIEENTTRAADAVEACHLLEQVDATLLGVVITGSGVGAENPPPIDSPGPRTSRTPAATEPDTSPSERIVAKPVALTEREAPQ
ncbi:MAG: hypothetical protein ACRDRZ_06575 [Pseudonocardiaceae bacterium]